MNCRNKTCRIPIVWRILIGFILGIVLGIAAPKIFGEDSTKTILAYVSPFGSVLVSMLKMVVYPIILFSLVIGAASLPLRQSGKVGALVIGWYLATSVLATVLGVALAYALNPSMANASQAAGVNIEAAAKMTASCRAETFGTFLAGLFQNPFAALATGQFLPIVLFAISFGLCARWLLDTSASGSQDRKPIETMLLVCDGAQKVSFRLIDCIILYFPIIFN